MDGMDDGFLRAIRDRPADALPRLVYADYVDEHGRPDEAAWLRADVRVATLFPDFDEADLAAVLQGRPIDGVVPLTVEVLRAGLGDQSRRAARFFGAVGRALTAGADELVRRGRLPG